MTEDEGGPTIREGGGSSPTQDDRDRDHGGTAGDAAIEEDGLSPDGSDEASAADRDAIDLEAVRDRAS